MTLQGAQVVFKLKLNLNLNLKLKVELKLKLTVRYYFDQWSKGTAQE